MEADDIDTIQGEAAIAALEGFVVENDELLELEERIGRFNIFDALRIDRVEIRHSNFLAWLLDPNESHGQGSVFLKAIVMDLLRQSPRELRQLSPVDLDGEELRGVKIEREWKRTGEGNRSIDILITCKQPEFAIAIENKVGGTEGDGQLDCYKQMVRDHFHHLRPMFVYLTKTAIDPSDDDWIPYGYADIYRVLTRLSNASHGAIGGDVTVFLEHYLRLIGSRFMDDPRIDELCQRIYTNHRQALQLIFERVGSPAAGILATVEQLVRADDHWRIINKTSSEIAFIPKAWEGLLPPIGNRKYFDPAIWIVVRLEIHEKRAYSGLLVWPTTDVALRRGVVERLMQDDNEFGLGTSRKREKITDSWTRLGRKAIASWDEDEGPDEQKIAELVPKQLVQWQKRLSGVPGAIRPIIDEWKRRRT